MYAAVRLAKCKPGTQAEVAARIRDEFVPQMQALGGLSAYFLITEGNDSLITVSVFDTEAHAHASNELARQWAPSALAGLLDGPLQPHEGEVFFQQ